MWRSQSTFEIKFLCVSQAAAWGWMVILASNIWSCTNNAPQFGGVVASPVDSDSNNHLLDTERSSLRFQWKGFFCLWEVAEFVHSMLQDFEIKHTITHSCCLRCVSTVSSDCICHLSDREKVEMGICLNASFSPSNRWSVLSQRHKYVASGPWGHHHAYTLLFSEGFWTIVQV